VKTRDMPERSESTVSQDLGKRPHFGTTTKGAKEGRGGEKNLFLWVSQIRSGTSIKGHHSRGLRFEKVKLIKKGLGKDLERLRDLLLGRRSMRKKGISGENPLKIGTAVVEIHKKPSRKGRAGWKKKSLCLSNQGIGTKKTRSKKKKGIKRENPPICTGTSAKWSLLERQHAKENDLT